MADKETFEVFLKIKHTAKSGLAVLVTDGVSEYWLPLSQITYDEPNKDDEATFQIPMWLAEKKGLVSL